MTELRSLLEEVGKRVQPRQDAFERLTRARPRRQRARRYTATGVALVLAVGGVATVFLAFRGIGDGRSARPMAPATGDTYGIHVNPPSGWDTTIRYPEGSLGPNLIVGNFPLRAAGAEYPYLEATSGMRKGDAAMTLQEFVDVCPCTGFEDAQLPIAIESDDLQRHPSLDHSTAFSAFRVSGRYLALRVDFGSDPVPDALLAEFNQVLATLFIEPGSPGAQSTPVEPVDPAPTFDPAAGWHTASASAPSSSADISLTWASNVPFAAEDLIAAATTGTLVFVPTETLQTLPPDGIVIVASNKEAIDAPDLEPPVSLADAEIQRSWEAQVAPNIPLYWIVADVDGTCPEAPGPPTRGGCLDVRIYFGTQTPDSETLAEADEQLARLRVP